MTRKTLSIISALGVLAAGACIMVLLSSFKAEASVTEEPDRVRTVVTSPLVPAAQTVWIEADGFLTARRQLDLTVPVSGKVTFALGGLKGGIAVEEGDVLLKLDDRRADLAFEGSRTEMIQRVNQFLSVAGLDGGERDLWDLYLDRLEKAGPSGLPRLPDCDERVRLLAVTKGVIASGYALESAALDLTDHTLAAPFAGVLTGEGITGGTWIAPGSVLGGLVEVDSLELSLALGADDLLHVSPGDDAIITRPEDGRTLGGTVDRIEPLLNSGSQTARVHISFAVPEGESWLPGAFVSARIGGQRFESACRIPRELLVGNRIPLYGEGKLILSRVSVLAYDGEDVIVASEFPEGAEYVTTILQNPMEGMLLDKEENR